MARDKILRLREALPISLEIAIAIQGAWDVLVTDERTLET
ncbi:hypothetical protein FVEN_g13040 [Fusarium venenatum]|nr:hypothetical protein FVEN_g13040 [Fusarium venenatum]